VNFAHQRAECAVDLLMALQGTLADKGTADNDRLVVRFQPAAVHVAFISQIQMHRGKRVKCGANAVDFGKHNRAKGINHSMQALLYHGPNPHLSLRSSHSETSNVASEIKTATTASRQMPASPPGVCINW